VCFLFVDFLKANYKYSSHLCHSTLESPFNHFSLQENIVSSSWVYLLEWLIWVTDPETMLVIDQCQCKHMQVHLSPLAATMDVYIEALQLCPDWYYVMLSEGWQECVWDNTEQTEWVLRRCRGSECTNILWKLLCLPYCIHHLPMYGHALWEGEHLFHLLLVFLSCFLRCCLVRIKLIWFLRLYTVKH